MSPRRLLLLGVSVRALAASAARSRQVRERYPGGLLALDYFGDVDLAALASNRPLRVVSLRRDLGRSRSVLSLARAALELDWEAFAYSGGLENRPGLLRRLERRGAVLGNGADAVGRVRDPAVFFSFLRREGIPHPPTWTGSRKQPTGAGSRFLWKGIRSGGGLRLNMAVPGEPRPRGHYRQQYLPGTPGSVAFVADGSGAAILGVSEQIVGFRALGGSGFRYGGNIAGPAEELLPAGALSILSGAAASISRRFGLRGLNGLDFILFSGVPHIIEVNPRYTASMELHEELSGRNFLDIHLRATGSGPLPRGPLTRPWERPGGPRFLAKGILYAEGDVRGPDPQALAALGCRDLPAPGEPIAAGSPVCTVVTAGASPSECRRILAERAGGVRRLLSSQSAARHDLPAHLGSW